jgi:uncharacterized protein YheU (UPF0270 family)
VAADEPALTPETDPSLELTEPVEVPYNSLTPELLRAICESVVLREGTDYGQTELTLEQKVTRLQEQFRLGRIKLLFDPQSESVNFINE